MCMSPDQAADPNAKEVALGDGLAQNASLAIQGRNARLEAALAAAEGRAPAIKKSRVVEPLAIDRKKRKKKGS